MRTRFNRNDDLNIPYNGMPVQVISNKNVKEIEEFGFLSDDGTVWYWWGNEYRQVQSLSNVTTISKNAIYSLVVKSDGTVWAWGRNMFGQLGDGTTTERENPVQVVGSGGVGFLNLNATVPSLPALQPQSQPTAPSAWAEPLINQAVALGLVPQDLQSNYTMPTTRAEFATLAVVLYETVTSRTIAGRMTFNDTDNVNVKKAGYLGIVTGMGDGNFNPNGQLTREQSAVMLARLASAIGQPLPQSAQTFADNAQVSSWAFDAVGQVQAIGIMGGVGDNQFAPSGDYTREQSIVTILRLFELLN